jgi:hypothetical protein
METPSPAPTGREPGGSLMASTEQDIEDDISLGIHALFGIDQDHEEAWPANASFSIYVIVTCPMVIIQKNM